MYLPWPEPEVTSQSDVEEQVIETVEAQLDAITARLATEVDRRALLPHADDRFIGALRAAGVAELHAGMVGYKLDRRLPASPPAETAALARRAAKARVPLTALLNIYMVALTVYWETIYDAIVATRAPAGVQGSVMRAGTRYLHEYMAKISGLAAAEYTDERDRALRRRALNRLGVVRDFLSGAEALDAILGHDLRDTHLGVVATGAGADDVLASLGEHPRLRTLTVSDDESVWVWISGPVESIAQAERAIARATADNVRVGIGRPQGGVDGFRTTHRQALAAHELAVTLGRAAVRHEEVALTTLLARDSDGARAFVNDELGPLLADPRRGERLLDTLEAYLDSGQNGVAAAARLNVSARSVSHRLRLIEQVLRRPIAGRAAELHAALRLRRVMSVNRPG